MINHSVLTFYLTGGAVFLLLCLLVALAWYKRRIDKISAHIGGIPQGDVAKLHQVVFDQNEITRAHISGSMGTAAHNIERLKDHLFELCKHLRFRPPPK
jgi:hypothetical protein